jgi:hypothetical protein
MFFSMVYRAVWSLPDSLFITMEFLIKGALAIALVVAVFLALVVGIALWAQPTAEERAAAFRRRQRMAEAWSREHAPGRVVCLPEPPECRVELDGGRDVAVDCFMNWCQPR